MSRIADDLIRGAKPLADEIGWTERQVRHAHANGLLPTFSIGRIVCARRSTINAHLAALEAGRLQKAS